MVVVVTIVGLVAAVAIPLAARVKQRNELNDFARRTLGDLREARALGASGRIISPSSTPTPAPAPAPCPPGLTCASSMSAPAIPANDIRVRYGGVRVASTTSYTVFADDDNIANNGGEIDLTVVDFTAKNPASTVRIISPTPGTEIRFQSNGLRSSGPNVLILEDSASGFRKTISITAAGTAKL